LVLSVRRKRLVVTIVAGLLLCAILVLVLAMCSSSSLVVMRYTVRLGSRGIVLRIVQLSDLHLRGFGDFEKSVVEKVAELRPDIVVLTGDYIEDPKHGKHLEKFVSLLRKELGSVPIYAVIGNWELQGSTLNIVEKIFARYGIELLINDYRTVVVKGLRIVIVGFDDYLWGVPNASLIRSLPRADLYIALIHEPVFAKTLSELGFRGIVFAGHCHGGQVKVFGYPLFLPRGCPRDLYEGMHRLGDTVLIVSRGIGTTILPLRIGTNPEIVVLDIVV